MNRKSIHVYQGRLVEEEDHLSLRQICEYCCISEDEMAAFVEEGIIEPLGSSRSDWTFRFTSAARVKKVLRLQHDFELNLSAVALILQLLDRIEQLESRIHH